MGKWQATRMDCDACGHEWAAVHPVEAEYLECPVCHHMTPDPYVEEKTMDLEIVNRLFLELSQITTATTGKEIALQKERDQMARLLDAHVSRKPCAECGESKPLPLRRDDMGGYVCLSCVEKRLNDLLAGVGNARQAAIELCWQIEKLGASEEQTKCSVMASELHSKLNDLLP